MSGSLLFVGQSAALWGLLAVAIPVIIHLLSKSKGKLIVFAAIQFIVKTDAVTVRQIKLQQWLLLILRILLITCSVMLLAKVIFAKHDKLSDPSKVVWLSPLWLEQSQVTDKQTMLEKELGSEFRLLTKENSKLSEEQVLSWSKPSQGYQPYADSYNAWLLVSELLQKIDVSNHISEEDNTPVASVYTTNLLAEFDGEKLSLPYSVDWQILKSVKLTDELKQEPIKPTIVLLESGSFDAKRYFYAASNILASDALVSPSIQSMQLPRARDGKALAEFEQRLNDISGANADTLLDQLWLFYSADTPLTDEQGNLLATTEAILALVARGANLVALPSSLSSLQVFNKQARATSHSHQKAQGFAQVFRPLDFSKGKVFSLIGYDAWQQLATQTEFIQWLYSLMLYQKQNQYFVLHAQLTTEQILPEQASSSGLAKHDTAKRQLTDKEGQKSAMMFWAVLLIILWMLERLVGEYQFVGRNDRAKETSS